MAVRKLIPIGTRFGRLTVVGHELKRKKSGDNISCAICECDCGKKKSIVNNSLKKGLTQSCGCLHKEKTSLAKKKHGLTHKSIYNCWANMKQRCLNINNVKNYKDYGGRGIKICEKWVNFEGFYEDMSKNYWEGATIERIDVNGDYCPENCKWVTAEQQAINKRFSVRYFYDGKWWTAKDLDLHLGIGIWNVNRKYPRKKLYELED
jgi:hypothetical protein